MKSRLLSIAALLIGIMAACVFTAASANEDVGSDYTLNDGFTSRNSEADGYYEYLEDFGPVIPICVQSDRNVYAPNEPIVFSGDILGGVPPFQVRWSVEESQTRDEPTLLDIYLETHPDDFCTAWYTTYSRHVEFVFIPPVESTTLFGLLYITDANGYESYPLDGNCAAVDPPAMRVPQVNGTTYRAVCVGQNYSSILTELFEKTFQLHGSVADAERLSVLLSVEGGYDVRFMPDASKMNIRNVIDAHFKDADDDDISLFFYTGHGSEPEKGSLITFEGNSVQDYLLDDYTYKGYITIQELMSWLGTVRGIKIIILDSCFSGSFVINNPYLDQTFVVMTACTNTQLSYEKEHIYDGVTGVFSHYLREGIDEMNADMNRDSRISAAELAQYIRDAILMDGFEQTSMFCHCSEDVIIINKIPRMF